MPPLPSEDEESSSDERIPYQKQSIENGTEKAEESGDESPGAEDDQYVVEKIMGHRFVKGEIEFDVKWQGYDDPKDRTWEPENNMDGAIDVMKEYYEDIGGRPEPKGLKRKGRSSMAKIEQDTPTSTIKRAKQEKQWSPPPGSWEHEVSHIDTVEETNNPKTGERQRFAYLVWNNQKKTQHPLKHVYQKCPQKMLLYYESHLVFTPNQEDGEVDMDGESNSARMQESY